MRTISLALLALWLGIFTASSAPPAIAGLVGYWPMDEGEGAIVDECSGTGLGGAGRVQGAVMWEENGGRPALQFDGRSTAVRIPSNPAWDFGEGSLTVCLWVKKSSKDGRTGLTLDHYFSGTAGAWGLVDGPMFALYNDAKKGVKLGFPSFAYDQWQHLAIVWRKAVDGELTTYLNGRLVGHLEEVICISKLPFDLFVGARQGTDQYSTGAVRDLAIFDRALTAPEIAAIHASGVPLGSPLVVSSIQPDKILYRPTETGTVNLRVKNVTDTPQRADLVLYLESGLHERRELHREQVELPAKAARLLHFPLAFQDERFGCAVRAVVEQKGKSLAEKSDYFSVSDGFSRVGIGSSWEGGLHTALGKYSVIPEAARKLYSNYFEIFFWSPCDWALHVAPQQQWWSGQASYPEDEDNLVDLIGKSHAQGIKVAFYASCNPAGPYGWEAARRHPEWFGGGNLSGDLNYNVEALDRWNDAAWRANVKANPGWFRLGVDLRREDALDYGIDRLVDGARKYRFDAVRFDGHYTILGNDEMSTRNMRRLKERVWKEIPELGFGFNYGRAPEWLGGVTHEMREGMAGGGMYLQEGIRNWRYTNDSYTSWQHYATNELRIAKLVQSLGGDYHCMWSDTRLTPAQAYYKLVSTA